MFDKNFWINAFDMELVQRLKTIIKHVTLKKNYMVFRKFGNSWEESFW